MSKSKRISILLALPLILGLTVLFFSLQTCKKFEPDGFLHVETGSVSGVTGSAAQVVCEVSDDGGVAVTARGVCWGTAASPTVSGTKTINGDGTGSYTSHLSGLLPSTRYFIRAYATNSRGTTYGEEKQFTTLAGDRTPSVTTVIITAITSSSASGGGEVISNGGFEITARGVCWGTSSDPTISGSKTSDGTGTGSFTSEITGLSASTTYYVRAYATNSYGTSYGAEESFTTSSKDFTVTDIDGNVYQTIRIGEQLWMAENLKTTRYADGTAIPHLEDNLEWGALGFQGKAYCWYDNLTNNRDIYGGLYTWSAAMNGASGSYDNPSGVQGVCPSDWHLPSGEEWRQLEMYLGMTREEADSWGWRSDDVGGKLKQTGTDLWNDPNIGATNESGFTALPGALRDVNGWYDDGLGFTARFWTTSDHEYPDQANVRYLHHESSGVNSGFTQKKSGLSVRCVHGRVDPVEPTVTTAAIASITSESVTAGGEVSSGGGVEVIARGVCWSISSGPTISDDTTINGGGTGIYESQITGLDPNTMYYVRAYATNSVGTAYGDEVSFTSKFAYTGTVTDIDENVYNTVQIGDQLWMAQDLRTTRYANGDMIPHVEDSVAWDALGYDEKAYCWYDNTTENRDAYGGLYTWPAAMNGELSNNDNPSGLQGVCPDGFHLPSDDEWKQLEKFLGMSQEDADLEGYRGTDEGGKLKETGTDHWDMQTGSTNESGFAARGGGHRHLNGEFQSFRGNATYWSTTDSDASNVWCHILILNSAKSGRTKRGKPSGVSVRCVGD